ncbi:MAG: GntR family transcriptional regulator [Alcaligenes sp.]|nr:GntR family transcriptional regulator [Alcaligenes sp.]HCA15938.1 GntR family transcriptional regulator [Alcaligenes faecalis]
MHAKLSGKLQARPHYVDEVYRILLDAISDGSLAPGSRITQEDIAEQLKVSRSPVLQAIQLLKKDGLLQDAEGRGVMVAPLNLHHIGHLYQVRGALEALATKLAAQQSAILDPDLIRLGRKVARGHDVRAMIEADEAFHKAIYEASGNPMIAESAQVHWVHLRRVMGAVLQSAEQRMSIWDEHEELAAAIASGDEAGAIAICERHMNNASDKLLSRLQEILEQPN